jgi:hypothetical protein
VLLLAALFSGLPPLTADTMPPIEAAARAIQADATFWPIFVWPGGDRAFKQVALRLGMSQREADASTNGHDMRVRSLRSCSTAAVRDASASASRTSVRILIVDDACSSANLSGRGVRCGTPQVLSFHVVSVTCEVDPRTPLRPFPLAVPISNSDRAIPPGYQDRFADAAAPFRLAKADTRGVVLSNIGIYSNRVGYELQSRAERNAGARVLVSPRFVDDEIVGSEVTLEPAEQTLPPVLRESVRTLREALLAHLTPTMWNEVYGPVTIGRGKADIRPGGWLVVAAVAGIVLAAALVRDRPRRPAAQV